MALYYQANGNLIDGIYNLTFEEFENEYGYNPHRLKLIGGFKQASKDLKECGCESLYVDGSFVTKKNHPNDYDVCWDINGVDLTKLYNLYPIFFDFSNSRQNQKKKYFGEFFPSTAIARPFPKELYIDFFRHDKDDNPKGIILIKLNLLL